MSEARVRACAEADLDAVSVLAEKLVRFHHELDPRRFLIRDRVREGYRWWLGQELSTEKAVITVAVAAAGTVLGYAYGRLEERDWMRLVDAHGKLHDVWVEEGARGTGVAERLVRACVAELEAKGAEQVLLDTAWANPRARRFFEKLGFAPTMLEMGRPRGR